MNTKAINNSDKLIKVVLDQYSNPKTKPPDKPGFEDSKWFDRADVINYYDLWPDTAFSDSEHSLNRTLYNLTDIFNISNVVTNSAMSDCASNVSLCTDVDRHRLNRWALLLVIFPVLTLFGNVLVILSVVRERSLQTVTNYFIVSLAVADLLVAVVVMPFGLYYLVNGEWGLPSVVCDCYIAIDVTCSTSSILNLVAISVDRFIAVTQPIKYAKHRNNTRVWVTIGAVWLVSAGIGSPIVLGLNNTPDRSYRECLFNSSDYIIYSSLGSFYIPCICMMFLYFNIFKAIRTRAKKQRSAKKPPSTVELMAKSKNTGGAAAVIIENMAQTTLEPALDERNTNTASGSNEDDPDEDESVGRETEPGVGEPRGPRSVGGMGGMGGLAGLGGMGYMLATVVEETGLIMANLASPMALLDPTTNTDSGYVPSLVEESALTREPSPCARDPHSDVPTADSTKKEPAPPSRKSLKMIGRSDSSVSSKSGSERRLAGLAVPRLTIYRQRPAKREKSFAKKEKKATQTLAIVLGVFLFCWAPFFSCSVVGAICAKLGAGAACTPGLTLYMLTTWLGYINSFLNPVIYTIFNLEFRKAFNKIMHCN